MEEEFDAAKLRGEELLELGWGPVPQDEPAFRWGACAPGMVRSIGVYPRFAAMVRFIWVLRCSGWARSVQGEGGWGVIMLPLWWSLCA